MTAMLGALMTGGDAACDKRYFVGMIDEVRAKLAHLAHDSPIKRSFPGSRLEAIHNKVEANTAEDLEWHRWQPLFLFVKNSSDAAIQAFDDDLRLIEARSVVKAKKLLQFLASESDGAQPWAGGMFEVYVKATALRGMEISNVSLDWKLPNGRRPDLKIDIGGSSICIECTSLGESDASDERWHRYTDALQANRDDVLVEWQDPYTQSRRLYAKVFDKIAPGLDAGRSQLDEDGPNLILLSLNAVTSDLSACSPAVGWALDEFFATQPTGDRSPASMCNWLLLQRKQVQPASSSFDDLVKALAQVSGILIFDGCKLRAARINYNADAVHMISHSTMAAVEHLLSVPFLYTQ